MDTAPPLDLALMLFDHAGRRFEYELTEGYPTATPGGPPNDALARQLQGIIASLVLTP